jgi:hypothetical protein
MNKYIIFSHYYDTENNRVIDGESLCNWYSIDDNVEDKVISDMETLSDNELKTVTDCQETLCYISENVSDLDKRSLEEKYILPSLNPYNPKHNMFFIYKGFNKKKIEIENKYSIKEINLDIANRTLKITITNTDTSEDAEIDGNYIPSDGDNAKYNGKVKRKKDDTEFLVSCDIEHTSSSSTHTYKFSNIKIVNNKTKEVITTTFKNSANDEITEFEGSVTEPSSTDGSSTLYTLNATATDDSTTWKGNIPIVTINIESTNDSIMMYCDKMERVKINGVWFYKNKVLSLKDLETKVKRFVSIYGKENILIGKEVDLKEYIDFV